MSLWWETEYQYEEDNMDKTYTTNEVLLRHLETCEFYNAGDIFPHSSIKAAQLALDKSPCKNPHHWQAWKQRIPILTLKLPQDALYL